MMQLLQAVILACVVLNLYLTYQLTHSRAPIPKHRLISGDLGLCLAHESKGRH
jgi:hypothetical protein